MEKKAVKKSLEEISRIDGRYDVRALRFIYEGLGKTIQDIREESEQDQPRHITGAELSHGLARQASRRWGWLAKMVLNQWGIVTTRDLGEIVYLMIDNKWMAAQDTDRIEDFDDVFDFEIMFEKNYSFEKN